MPAKSRKGQPRARSCFSSGGNMSRIPTGFRCSPNWDLTDLAKNKQNGGYPFEPCQVAFWLYPQKLSFFLFRLFFQQRNALLGVSPNHFWHLLHQTRSQSSHGAKIDKFWFVQRLAMIYYTILVYPDIVSRTKKESDGLSVYCIISKTSYPSRDSNLSIFLNPKWSPRDCQEFIILGSTWVLFSAKAKSMLSNLISLIPSNYRARKHGWPKASVNKSALRSCPNGPPGTWWGSRPRSPPKQVRRGWAATGKRQHQNPPISEKWQGKPTENHLGTGSGQKSQAARSCETMQNLSLTVYWKSTRSKRSEPRAQPGLCSWAQLVGYGAQKRKVSTRVKLIPSLWKTACSYNIAKKNIKPLRIKQTQVKRKQHKWGIANNC